MYMHTCTHGYIYSNYCTCILQSVRKQQHLSKDKQQRIQHDLEKIIPDGRLSQLYSFNHYICICAGGQENINPASPHMSPREPPMPDPHRPHPLTPPPVPVQSLSLPTPLPKGNDNRTQQHKPPPMVLTAKQPLQKEPVLRQHQPVQWRAPSVIVPCGTACAESDLSIHTIPPSEQTSSSSVISGANPSSLSSSDDPHTGGDSTSAATTSSNTQETTCTSESTSEGMHVYRRIMILIA